MNKKATERDSRPTFTVVTLGCSKNEVDSRKAVTLLESHGFRYADRDAGAPDLVLVNTCAFTEDARKATMGELKMLHERLSKHGSRIVIMGCYISYPGLDDEFEEIADSLVSFDEYMMLPVICGNLLNRGPQNNRGLSNGNFPRQTYSMDFLNIASSTRPGSIHSAFLKISEGCSNRCRYCTIPNLRGEQVSRPLERVVEEARMLVSRGAVELNIVGQDTTSYGRDIYGGPRLIELLSELVEIEKLEWLRLNYCYPGSITEDLIDLIAGEEKICPYVDIPLQHINDNMLRAMGRHYSGEQVRNLIARLREKIPRVQIVSSFIVGFPGECDKTFNELIDFVKEGQFRYVNCTPYSRETNTAAYSLGDDIPPDVKRFRVKAIQGAQLEVFGRLADRDMGRKIPVLVDRATGDFMLRSEYPWEGRSIWDAPEDSRVLIASAVPLEKGRIYDVAVRDRMDYHLLGSWED